MVVKRGVNEHSVLPMARFFREQGHILRFIEFMDVGATNGWKMEHVVPSRELVETIHRELPIEPLDPNYRGRGGGALALLRRQRRDRLHLFGDAGLLPQLHSRAPVRRRPALHLPVRHARARTSARCCAAERPMRRSRRSSAGCGRPAPTATPRSAPPRRRRCARWRCRTSAAKPTRRSSRILSTAAWWRGSADPKSDHEPPYACHPARALLRRRLRSRTHAGREGARVHPRLPYARHRTVERLHVRAALGRVLAEDVVSDIDVPGARQLGDGWLCDAASGIWSGSGETVLRVVGASFAGRPFAGTVGAARRCAS